GCLSASCRRPRAPRGLPPSPTRRSSDLELFTGGLGGLPRHAINAAFTAARHADRAPAQAADQLGGGLQVFGQLLGVLVAVVRARSEEHTSELQSRENLVCRPLLEKKNHD